MITKPISDSTNEDKIQAEAWKRVWNDFPLTQLCLFAVPNGGNRDALEAMKLMATGTLAGVNDMIFYWNGKAYFIEMKDDTGTVRAEQKFFHRSLAIHGMDNYVFRTVDEVYNLIRDIITRFPLSSDDEARKMILLRERREYLKEKKYRKQKRSW
jgi:hypothetical protein